MPTKQQLAAIYSRLQTIAATLAAYAQSLMPRKSRIKDWALAIQEHEGWFVGSRSYRNNNPGNMKYGTYVKTWGNAYGQDDKGFARFYSYDDGFDCLCGFLRDTANWLMIPYRAYAQKHGISRDEFSLLDFFEVYAPSGDDNDPHRYAEVVAMRLGVPPETPIKDLL